MKKKLFTLFILVSLLAFSHPGRTDANGVCPYESSKTTNNKTMSEADIKKNLEILGYYGDDAIADFQRDNGLVADGVAGKKTIKKIRELLGN